MPRSQEHKQGGNASRRLARQWTILRLLERRAFSIRDLAFELGVSKSSVQRDIETLKAHFAIVTVRLGAQKRAYQLPKRSAPRAIVIDDFELAALESTVARSKGNERTLLASLLHKVRVLRGR